MASLYIDKRGYYEIQYHCRSTGKRPKIRLGIKNDRESKRIYEKIEDLINAKNNGIVISDECLTWLKKIINSKLFADLSKFGLTGTLSIKKGQDLSTFLKEYIESRKGIHKPWTIKNQHTAANLLLAFFGNNKNISDITQADGENFFNNLSSKKYAPATISRAMRRAITFFKFAQKSKILLDNPFSGIKLPKQTNRARMQFIDRTTIQKVLDYCPNTQWKLIVCLARVGGLRIPSELVGLTWDCIHWDKKLMTVHSPKTEHNDGGAFRVIPLFPEIESLLQDALKDAPKGQLLIFPTVLTSTNLRRRLTQIIKKAGVPLWKKLFQNLRASRSTELANDYPAAQIKSWLGNLPDNIETEPHKALVDSAKIMGHSLKVSNEHYQLNLQENLQRVLSEPCLNIDPNVATRNNNLLPKHLIETDPMPCTS